MLREAPIVLFAYNRPLHTARVLETLAANSEASRSFLRVYHDGLNREEHRSGWEAVRNLLTGISGFGAVEIISRDSNFGLADSIIDGVGQTVTEHGRVIVLEDDIVVSSSFLSYMNRALRHFADEPKVMQVSGFSYPVMRPEDLPPSVFLPLPTCWGWGTWDRAWANFQRSDSLAEQFTREMIREFTVNHAHTFFWHQLLLNRLGRLKTWFIYWYASMFLVGGLALFPRRSLVANIGFDGSGVHCAKEDEAEPQAPANDAVNAFPDDITPSVAYRMQLEEFLCDQPIPRKMHLKMWALRQAFPYLVKLGLEGQLRCSRRQESQINLFRNSGGKA